MLRHSGTREARTRNPEPNARSHSSGFRVRSLRSRPGMTGGNAFASLPNSVVKQPSGIARIICDAGCVVSLFRLPRKRGDGAPGGARELAQLPSTVCEAGVSRQDSGTRVLRGVGVPWRAGPCEEPCASRRSIAATLSGAAPCSAFERRDRRRPRLSKACGGYGRTFGRG